MKAQDKQQISTLSRQIFQDFGVSFKAGTKASMARLAALVICQKARKNDAFVQQIGQHLLATLKTYNVISHADAAFAMRLSRGVVATYGTLDEFINASLLRPGDIKPNVRDALRISTYEILFLKKEPYAVVFEGVELVRAVAPKAAGLANAVLRKMIASADVFLGDHEQDKIFRLARRNAFPVWLVERVISDLGADNASLFCEQANEDAPLFVAANTMLISENEL
ncbi:MAG: hypothetical protein IJV62_03905, partial [Eggerthellaceae bacterium]|nr:hypothetical protein [Eggerthellaceae bacterium]